MKNKEPKKLNLKIIENIFSIIFIVILLFLAICNLIVFLKSDHEDFVAFAFTKDNVKTVEKTFNDNFIGHQKWIDLYGGTQLLQQKNEINNFEVVKDLDGFLHRPISKKSNLKLNDYADNLELIHNYSKSNNIPFLYIQAPSDFIKNKTKMPLGMEYQVYQANDNIDRFLEILHSKDIPYLDVRDCIENMPLEDIFFKTDHHWTMPIAFKTFQTSIEILNAEYNLKLDSKNFYRNLSNYNIKIFPNSLLGSRGIRTGSLYVSKDSLHIYEPKFETYLTNRYFVENVEEWSKTGNFNQVFIDQDILNDPNYLNKYNAYMFGSLNENRINNHTADSKLHCLLISDSFSRPLVPYYALCFEETVWLDPRRGRFNDNYRAYTENFQPDCIIVLFNGNELFMEFPWVTE